LFFRYPAELEKVIKGVSYKIITIDSTFAEGKFTQQLSCAINTFADPEEEATTGEEAGAEEKAEGENTEGTNET